MDRLVAEVLPDRTLQLRLETGDNDPVLPAHDFNVTPVREVISYLNESTGQKFSFDGVLRPLRGQGGRGGGPAPVEPDLVGRGITLHLDSAPVSRMVAQVLDALEQQADIVHDESQNPQFVAMRLAASAAAQMTYTEQWENLSAIDAIGYLRDLTGKSIIIPPPMMTLQVLKTVGTITLKLEKVSRTEATTLLRDALEQQSGIVLDEQPDGSFVARLVGTPSRANADDASPLGQAIKATQQVISAIRSTTGAGYVGPNVHQTLNRDLNNLDAAAKAVGKTTGNDPTQTDNTVKAFTTALDQTITLLGEISQRKNESDSTKQISRQLESELRDIRITMP